MCSKYRAKFSVFYNDETQEFYTNILEKSKIRTFSQPEKKERAEIRFCARCGLNVGIIAQFCMRCGLKILRDSIENLVLYSDYFGFCNTDFINS